MNFIDICGEADKDARISVCKYKIKEEENQVICVCTYQNCSGLLLYERIGDFYRFKSRITHSADIEHTVFQPCDEMVIYHAKVFLGANQTAHPNDVLKYLRTLYPSKEQLDYKCLYYLLEKYIFIDYKKGWQVMPNYIKALTEHGITAKIEPHTINEKSFNYVYIESPFAKDYINSNVFTRILFTDAAHLQESNIEGVIMIVNTITPNHSILNLCCSMIDSENTAGYKFMFTEFKKILPNCTITMIADQHQSIKTSIEEILQNTLFSPCAWHLIKDNLKSQLEFFQLVRSESLEILEYKWDTFSKKYPKSAVKVDKVKHLLFRVLGAPFRFGCIASSPIESSNNAVSSARKSEPIYMLQEFLLYSIRKYHEQLQELLSQNGNYVKYVDEFLKEKISFSGLTESITACPNTY